MKVKGCLVLQRRFAYVGHEIALLLKEKYNIDEFCVYVYLRESYKFLRDQKDLEYSALLLDEDVQKKYKDEVLDLEFLASFEKEYGSVWDFISVDRVMRFGQLAREYPYDTSPYTHEELLRIVQGYAKHLLAFIEKEKPDFLFTYQPGAMGSLMLYRIAKRKGIPVITVVFPYTKNRMTISDAYDRLTGVEEKTEKSKELPVEMIPCVKEARECIEEFRDKPSAYSSVYSSVDRYVGYGRRKQFAFLAPRKIVQTVRYNSINLFRLWFGDKERRSDYTTQRPFYYLDCIKRKIRALVGVNDLFDAFDPNVPYVFYPLHFEPELSVLLLSPFDTNQLEIVKRVAQSLPVGMYVYVKEHPLMVTYRPRRFYKELKKIPNVKLLRPELASFPIVKHSKLVTIISGAVGWEASLMGKPVITFGSVFYNALPSVRNTSAPEELPGLVRSQLTAPFDEEALTRYVAALYEDSARCDLLEIWENTEAGAKKRQDLEEFAALIGKKIQLLKKA